MNTFVKRIIIAVITLSVLLPLQAFADEHSEKIKISTLIFASPGATISGLSKLKIEGGSQYFKTLVHLPVTLLSGQVYAGYTYGATGIPLTESHIFDAGLSWKLAANEVVTSEVILLLGVGIAGTPVHKKGGVTNISYFRQHTGLLIHNGINFTEHFQIYGDLGLHFVLFPQSIGISAIEIPFGLGIGVSF